MAQYLYIPGDIVEVAEPFIDTGLSGSRARVYLPGDRFQVTSGDAGGNARVPAFKARCVDSPLATRVGREYRIPYHFQKNFNHIQKGGK